MAVEETYREPANIPTIDFGILANGTPEERCAELKKLDESLQSMGFIYLANHTIPQAKVDEALDWVGILDQNYIELLLC